MTSDVPDCRPCSGVQGHRPQVPWVSSTRKAPLVSCFFSTLGLQNCWVKTCSEYGVLWKCFWHLPNSNVVGNTTDNLWLGLFKWNSFLSSIYKEFLSRVYVDLYKTTCFSEAIDMEIEILSFNLLIWWTEFWDFLKFDYSCLPESYLILLCYNF